VPRSKSSHGVPAVDGSFSLPAAFLYSLGDGFLHWDAPSHVMMSAHTAGALPVDYLRGGRKLLMGANNQGKVMCSGGTHGLPAAVGVLRRKF
jgi:hypothetical protein